MVNDFPRVNKLVEELLHSWAIWVHTGGTTASKSMMARLMECKGHFNFGAGGAPAGGPKDTVEARVEAQVMAIAKTDPVSADALRLEYDAGWRQVLQRRGVDLKEYSVRNARQVEKARILGISERGYRYRLKRVKQQIFDGVTR